MQTLESLCLPYGESAPLPVGKVKWLHNVVMGPVRSRAQERGSTVLSDRPMRKYLFAVMNDGGAPMGSGDTVECLSVRVMKLGYSEWRMGISFLTYILSWENYYINSRELYSFAWSDREAYGVRRQREAMGLEVEGPSRLERTLIVEDGEDAIEINYGSSLVIGEHTSVNVETRHEVSIEDCEAIRERMETLVSTVPPRPVSNNSYRYFMGGGSIN